MTITYGLTNDGFVPRPLTQIRADLNAALQDAFGASIDLGDKSIFGQIVGIIAERLALLWEQLDAVNSSQDPDKATGAALEALAALTGTFRPPASFSAVLLTLTGVTSTLIAAGSQGATVSTGALFATSDDATLGALSTWAGTTGYLAGARVTNAGNAYQCTVAGTSAGSGGPTTTDVDITDNTAHWTFLGLGVATADVNALAVLSGAITGFSRDIATIVTQVSGWDGVINLLDATIGRAVATDVELRVLREAELSGEGSTPADAIRAHLLEITDVLAVTVFFNNTDVTNSDGLPPHSVESLVRVTNDAPHNQLIWDALLANVAAGIATYGSTTGTSLDSTGLAQTMSFSHPTEIPVYAIIHVSVDALNYPAGGDALVADAIATFGDGFATGRDVTAAGISAQAFTVSGMLDVTECFIGTAPGPVSGTTIPISLRQLATFDTSRVMVVSTPITP